MYLTQWGSYDLEDGQVNQVNGFVVDSPGNVYVAGIWNPRAQKFVSTDPTPTLSPKKKVLDEAGTPNSTSNSTCEDVNGDGVLDFNDVVCLFNKI